MDIREVRANVFKSKCGILSRCDGSSICYQGNTTMIAGVYGPIECKIQKILIDKASVEAHFRPKAGLPGIGDRLNETIIRNICETTLVATLYPRTSIVIVVQEMENGGELISCAVNAVCLALIDSGIDMKFLIASVTCCLETNGNFTMEPSTLQKGQAKATFIFVFENLEGKVIASNTTGTFNANEFAKAIDLCRQSSVTIFDYYKMLNNKKYRN